VLLGFLEVSFVAGGYAEGVDGANAEIVPRGFAAELVRGADCHHTLVGITNVWGCRAISARVECADHWFLDGAGCRAAVPIHAVAVVTTFAISLDAITTGASGRSSNTFVPNDPRKLTTAINVGAALGSVADDSGGRDRDMDHDVVAVLVATSLLGVGSRSEDVGSSKVAGNQCAGAVGITRCDVAAATRQRVHVAPGTEVKSAKAEGAVGVGLSGDHSKSNFRRVGDISNAVTIGINATATLSKPAADGTDARV
jgi:hypothetical protein